MATGVELATAYVSIVPEGSKIAPGLRKEFRGAQSSADKAGKTTGKRFSSSFGSSLKVAGALGAAFAAAKVTDLIGSSITAASDLDESINAVNVTFGDAAAGIRKLGEEAATSVGLSNEEFNGLAVRFSAFAKQVAGPGGDVVGTMEDLTTRAADFASVMNLDVAEAAEKFQSGLAGESEPLRQFGLNLSAAAVESFAYANGIADAGSELTEAQKVQARYGLIMKQTAKTQGDFSNTSDSLANAQRILGARWENLKAQLGQRLLPIIAKGVDLFSDFISGLQDGTGVGGKVADAFRKMGDALTPVIDYFRENPKLLKAVAVGLGVVAAAVALVTLATTAFSVALNSTGIPLIVIALAALVAGLYLAYQRSETFRNIVDQLGQVARRFGAFLRDEVLPIIIRVAKKVGEALQPVFAQLAKTWKNDILPAIQKLIAKFREWQPTIQKVIKAVVKIIGKVVEFGAKIIGKVLPPMIRFVGFIVSKVIPTVFRFARSVAEKVGDIVGFFARFRELPSKAKRAFIDVKNKVVGVFKDMVNAIIGAWNAIDLSIDFDISIPEWIPKVGGKSFGVHIGDLFPDVPRLASGGRVDTSGRIVRVAEGGEAESVLPDSMLRGILERAVIAGAVTASDTPGAVVNVNMPATATPESSAQAAGARIAAELAAVGI